MATSTSSYLGSEPREPHLVRGGGLIWSAADLTAFSQHADDEIRQWAWCRLALLFPQHAAEQAPRGLGDRSWSVASRALDAVTGAPSAEVKAAIERLLARRAVPADVLAKARRRLSGESDEPVSDPYGAEIEALAAAPDELAARAGQLLGGSSDDRVLALFAIERQPYRWAADVILERIDTLCATDDYRLAWDTLAELGDPRALPALLAAYRPGDRRLARLISELHRLAPAGALPADVQRDADAHRGTQAAVETRLRSRGGLDVLGELPRLDLRCAACGRVHEYEVVHAIINPQVEKCRGDRWDGVVLGRVVECKSCGAVDSYALTKQAHVAFLPYLIRAAAGELPADGPVVIGEARLWDGTVCRRPAAAIAQLRAQAERAGGREAWRRLGNLCERYGRMDEAVEAWLRAAADADEVEACYCLAKHFHERGQLADALGYAGKTIARLRGGAGAPPADLRGAMADTAFSIVRDALPNLRQPLALMASWRAGGGERTPVVSLSSVDLRRLRRWDALADFFADDAFISARLTSELPEPGPTQLSVRLERGINAAAGTVVRDSPKVGRNEPCPCGSGKKHKRCCGA